MTLKGYTETRFKTKLNLPVEQGTAKQLCFLQSLHFSNHQVPDLHTHLRSEMKTGFKANG